MLLRLFIVYTLTRILSFPTGAEEFLFMHCHLKAHGMGISDAHTFDIISDLGKCRAMGI